MEVPLREVHLEYTISPDYESEKALRFLMTLIFSQKFFLILTKRLLLRIITKLKRRIFPELNFLVKDFFQKREYRIVTKIFTKCNPLQLSAVDNNLKLRWHVSDRSEPNRPSIFRCRINFGSIEFVGRVMMAVQRLPRILWLRHSNVTIRNM